MEKILAVSGPRIRRYLKDPTKHTHIQFFRYGIVAVVAFMVDFGSLAVLVSVLGWNKLVAAGVAFSMGLVVNYGLSAWWVFTAYATRSRHWEFGVFAVTGLVGLGLTELFMWLFTDQLHVFYLISKCLTAFLVVIWNFTSRKVVLYR